MPTITAYPTVAPSTNVRVEVNWADTPAVQYARVLRYNTATGECEPLRPYICYDGDYLLLSCGHGIFWDTEAPWDVEFYYITEGLDAPCLPMSTLVSDSFNRVLANSWGSTEDGTLGPLAYTLTGGTVPANYDVNGTNGLHNLDSVNVFRHSTVDIAHLNQDVYATTSVPALATGAPFTNAILARFTDPLNTYMGRIAFSTAGQTALQITSLVGGVGTLLATTTFGTYVAGERFRIRFQVNGSNLRAKGWTESATEPAAWMLNIVDAGLPGGTSVGMASRRDTGNVNGTVDLTWDDFLVIDECVPCEPVAVDTSADPMTVTSETFWIKDPVRPCNDRAVPLCFTQANNAEQADGDFCIPGSGIFFASMETESYEPNTLTVNPTNAKYPIAVSRTRRAVASQLTLVTRTFTDRDDLLTLADPGSPLLLQGPGRYGIPDRYMDVATVAVNRGLSNHKYQVRVFDLPHVEVARPAGPTQGVCGAQVQDYCEFTWDELEAGGYTWDDLVRGTPTGLIPTAYRTWDEVEAGFADWNAVDNGIRTWTDLEVGN